MDKRQAKTEELFGRALDLPREQRIAFLNAASRGMPEVQRAVEDLLAENDRLSGFLSESPYKGVEETAARLLEVKTRLGRYLILEPLGSGGMGVVYRARDEKLERVVAIKMLAPGVLSGEEARRHFRQEGLAMAKLNHPQIAAVYDVGEHDGADFIVMELIEGESLAVKLQAGALGIQEATAIALQVAEALEEAHAHGVIHRDLKPANVMITPKGNAKVLDFGVAKMLALDTDATASLAETGGLLGTPLYMSPEQALGRKVDARTDLWSLGVLYFESLAGRPPFEGSGSLGVLHAITGQPPAPLRAILPSVPPLAEHIVTRALEKDCELRYQRAADLRTDLQRLMRDSSRSPWDASAPSPSQVASSSGDHRRAASKPWIATIAPLVLIVLAGFFAWQFWPRLRYFASISVSQITNIGTIERIALSADGRFLAEVKKDKAQRTLWVRNTATNTETQILSAFALDYVGLTFSPDGNRLYFTRAAPEKESERDLYVMSVFGGTPRKLIANIDSAISFAPDGNKFTFLRWLPDQKDNFSEIHISDKDGGNDQLLSSTAEEAQAPVWSPDGTRIAWFQTEAGTTRIALKVMEIFSKKLTSVPAPAGIFWVNPGDAYTTLAWLPDSRHLLAFYYKQHTDRAQIGVVTVPSGEFHSVTNDVNSYSQLALSGNGRTLATVLTNVDSSIALYGPDGGEPVSTLPLRVTPNAIAWATEDHLLYIVGGLSSGTIDRSTGSVQSFDTGEVAPGDFIASCPDGHILFTGFPKGGSEPRLFSMNADGGEIAQLTTSGFAQAPSCSADSQKAYFSTGNDVNVSLWSIPVAGGTPKLLVRPENYAQAAVSHDGTRAMLLGLRQQKICAIVADLATGQMQPPFFIDQSLANFFKVSLDGRAIVSDVLRNGGTTLLYQPLDGSPPHALFNPAPETINSFDWSPSGKQLAVARLKSSSDVVLITDQAGKETH